MSPEALATHLIEYAAQHDFTGASRDFDQRMSAGLPPEKFASTWESIEKQLGPFRAIESIAVELADAQRGLHAAVARVRFERGPIRVRVVSDGTSHVAGLFFVPLAREADWAAPPYANPATFTERSVQVGASPALPGVLTLPKSDAPVPAVVLVHGSGPNDADESIGGAKVFKDLAWGLGSRGIAVLRYVKRSQQSPLGIITQKEEVFDGARAAIELLRATPGVDVKRLFIVGHSEGGALAPRIARDNPPIAGIVVLSGPARPAQDEILAQLHYLAGVSGDAARFAQPIADAERFKRVVEDPKLAREQEIAVLGGGTLTGAYFLDQRGYDPIQVARAFTGSVLVLHGERDYQVPNEDFRAWSNGLDKRARAASRSYPTLNHLFVSGSGPSAPAEYQHPGHVDAAVIEDLSSWILRGALTSS